MTDEFDSLVVEVRAGTQGFDRDIEAMRSSLDGNLVQGFARAGTVLERGLLGAIRRGSLGFDDLKRIALSTMDAIAAQAVRGLFAPSGAAASATGGLAPLLGGVATALLGLPGRATGGNVSAGRGYLVGERGPELFVPTSSGRVEATPGRESREVKVAINVVAPRGDATPRSLARSSRQVASTVRRAISYT